MTEQQHPMVPPNILLNNWEDDWFNERENVDVLLTQAYQAGADAELEATLAEVSFLTYRALVDRIRAARRPKPSSLKEQALKEMDKLDEQWEILPIELDSLDVIRKALEALPDE
jgi:hypothetical protein